ncbi:hypothetical protein PYJP_11850 [Pyrofollis japonicus]|nr:hypothetical protein PYJP_11850 [Pyrofollis japonicus]
MATRPASASDNPPSAMKGLGPMRSAATPTGMRRTAADNDASEKIIPVLAMLTPRNLAYLATIEVIDIIPEKNM